MAALLGRLDEVGPWTWRIVDFFFFFFFFGGGGASSSQLTPLLENEEITKQKKASRLRGGSFPVDMWGKVKPTGLLLRKGRTHVTSVVATIKKKDGDERKKKEFACFLVNLTKIGQPRVQRKG